MIIRYRKWQGIAAVVLSFSSTSAAWAQLPSPGVSPLNQLGRSWGFGVSDGYHECPEPKKVKQAFARPATPAKTVSHPLPCADCEKKPSFFSKMNPFNEKGNAGNPSSCGPMGNGQMTVLPPSPNMYQTFAAPHETPLPGSNQTEANYPSTSAPSPSDQMIPSHSGTTTQGSSSSLGNQVPDPLEFNSLESPSLQSETFQSDTVPPPPALRKRQKGDKPLGEEENLNAPVELIPEPNGEKSGSKTDDSLDLLPKEEPPPITVHPKSDSRRSLISHATPVPETPAARPSINAQDAMLRQYYGQAYSRQEQPAPKEVLPGLQIGSQPTGSAVNRYR